MKEVQGIAGGFGIHSVTPINGPIEFIKKGEVTSLNLYSDYIVRQCCYYADVFNSLGCPSDMNPTETKTSDYIKRMMGVE